MVQLIIQSSRAGSRGRVTLKLLYEQDSLKFIEEAFSWKII